MAVSIGKRKRSEQDNDLDRPEDEGAMRALFQRAFEAKFNPLERSEAVVKEFEPQEEEDDARSDRESEWSGLSAGSESAEIVYHDQSNEISHMSNKHEKKSFMSSRPPTMQAKRSTLARDQETDADEDKSEATNIKHDLALQRLLKESHLLGRESYQTSSTPDGKGRLKALDLRLKDLGAKRPASEQQKMPISHRKGIVAKSADREERRRKDASENNVVLEKFKTTSKGPKFRQKGVGGPGVGKFRGGTLTLSARDVRSIEGSKKKKRR